MEIHTVEVDADGNMNLPIELIDALGLEGGGKLLLESRGNVWVLRSVDDVHHVAAVLSHDAAGKPLEWDREDIWTEIATERDERIQQQARQNKTGVSMNQRSGWARETAGILPSKQGPIEPEELENLLERTACELFTPEDEDNP